MREELELRDQKLIFLNFKTSIMDTCAGISEKMRGSFLNSNLEEIIASKL